MNFYSGRRLSWLPECLFLLTGATFATKSFPMAQAEAHFGPVWFIPGINRGRYPYCHSIYIAGAGILVDPASDKNRLLELRDREGVREIWLSHWHEDHIAFIDLFPDAKIKISSRDEPPLTDLEILLDWYNLQPPHRDYWRQAILDTFRYRPRHADGYLDPGDVITLGDTTVEIIASPGHTPGHLALFFREQEILFLGDYDMTSFGPWYGDKYSNIEDTISSLRLLRDVPARTWLTGHDTGIFTDRAAERWRQYEDIIFQREERILALLTHPRTMEEIVQSWTIYGKPREPIAFFEFGERALAGKHLEWLQKKGTVKEYNGSYAKL